MPGYWLVKACGQCMPCLVVSILTTLNRAEDQSNKETKHAAYTGCAATDLGLSGSKLDETDALELTRLTVCRQAYSVDSTAVCKGCCKLLAHCILAQVLVKALDKDGGAIAV